MVSFCNDLMNISKTENNAWSYQGPHLTGFLIKAGVSQGSILEHLLFLVFTNAIVEE